MSLHHYNANQKASELKQKLDAQMMKFESLKNQYDEEITYYIKIKEQMETESDDLRWSIDQERSKNAEILEQTQVMN